MMGDLLLAAAMGVVAGASALAWWAHTRSDSNPRRRLPKTWPLKVRPLVSSKEQRVWTWMTKVMFDQQVLVKLPITRFTAPLPTEDAARWYHLLNGVYCTFTVCDMEGKVMGCVDIQKPHSRSASNQALKNALLSQCDIRYWVVDPAHLPSLTHIRAGLLGEQAEVADQGNGREHLEAQFNDVRNNQQAADTRQRSSKNGSPGRADAELHTQAVFSEDGLMSGWDNNSFITPLDSRAAPLKK